MVQFFTWIYLDIRGDIYKDVLSIKQNNWDSIKTNLNNYDLIFLGSSRGYCSFNPLIIDNNTELNSYNMCTSFQHIIESLYMFKEILKTQKPKYLVYEIFLPSFNKSPNYYHLFSNAKFMSNDMVFQEFKTPKLIDILYPIVKYKAFIKKEVENSLLSKKKSKDKSVSWYKGYKSSTKTNDSISITKFPPIYSFSNTAVMSTSSIEFYLDELKNLCDNHSVELICIRSPYPPSRLKKDPEYNTGAYFTKFLNSRDISFYDLSFYSKQKYSDYDFTDFHHLNSFGAKKTSFDLIEILNARKQKKLNKKN